MSKSAVALPRAGASPAVPPLRGGCRQSATMSGTPPGALPRPRLLRLKDGRDYTLRALPPATRRWSFSPPVAGPSAPFGYLIHDMTPDRAHRLADCDPARSCARDLRARRRRGERLRAMGGSTDRWAVGGMRLRGPRRLRRLGMASFCSISDAGRRRGLGRLFAQVGAITARCSGFRHHGARLRFRRTRIMSSRHHETKILFDPPSAPSFSVMAASSPFPLCADRRSALTAIAFGIFYWLVIRVPSTTAMVKLWGGLAAAAWPVSSGSPGRCWCSSSSSANRANSVAADFPSWR